MITRILVVGGYGNFGAHICDRLAGERNIQLVIGGRSAEKAQAFAAGFGCAPNRPEVQVFDYRNDFAGTLKKVSPRVVIHTSGPFQGQDYRVARACVDAGCHYVDLADGREFVTGIGELDDAARARGVTVVSGASSVPCLTAALIDHYIEEFGRLLAVDYGIATAQRTNRGLATTSAVLGYAGKPFTTLIDGTMKTIYGWQDVHTEFLPEVGRRYFANCDVPDLSIFPERYPDLRTQRFRASLEVPMIQLGLWLLTWTVRFGWLSRLEPMAPALLRVSRLFDRVGTDVSAFYMKLIGTAPDGRPKTVNFNLTARSGDGPTIPCVPAIVLAKRFARFEEPEPGAYTCVGIIDLATYLAELEGLDIAWSDRRCAR